MEGKIKKRENVTEINKARRRESKEMRKIELERRKQRKGERGW